MDISNSQKMSDRPTEAYRESHAAVDAIGSIAFDATKEAKQGLKILRGYVRR